MHFLFKVLFKTFPIQNDLKTFAFQKTTLKHFLLKVDLKTIVL